MRMPSFRRPVLLAAALALAGVSSASAAITSFVRVAGNAGDPVTNGLSFTLTSDVGSFWVGRGYGAHVNYYSAPQYGTLDFATPYYARLEPGTYSNVPLCPGQPLTQWGFLATNKGRSCTSGIANYTVEQVRYDSTGNVTSLIARFDQSCSGATGGLSGRVVYRADTSLYVVSPQEVYALLSEPVSFTVSATTVRGWITGITATGLPPGATFTDFGNGAGRLDWPAGSATTDTFLVTFAAADTSGQVASAVTAIRVHDFDVLRYDADPGEWVTQGLPRRYHRANATLSMWTNCCGAASAMATTPEEQYHFAFAAPNPRALTAGRYVAQSAPPGEYAAALAIEGPGRGCNVATGWFDVRQLAFDSQGRLARLWICFEHHCEGHAPAVRGEIRLNADTSLYVLPPADAYVLAHRETTLSVVGADTRGRPVTLSVQNVPAGCVFVDHGDGTATLTLTREVTQTGVLPITFTCRNDLGAEAVATTWLHVYPNVVDVPQRLSAAGLELEVEGASPNRSSPTARFGLIDQRPARLDVVDVAGRLVSTREVGALGPGTHRVSLSELATQRPGVYWVRLRSAGEQRIRSAIIAR